jgi:hypothetical protein
VLLSLLLLLLPLFAALNIQSQDPRASSTPATPVPGPGTTPLPAVALLLLELMSYAAGAAPTLGVQFNQAAPANSNQGCTTQRKWLPIVTEKVSAPVLQKSIHHATASTCSDGNTAQLAAKHDQRTHMRLR